jgi:predicted cobalt transporter CbtA
MRDSWILDNLDVIVTVSAILTNAMFWGVLGTFVAIGKHRHTAEGFIACFLLGPLGFIWLICQSTNYRIYEER